MKFGTIVPGLCFLCWPELKQGDRVKIREGNSNTRAALYGQEGVIKEIVQLAEQGTIYVATIGGNDELFVRSELKLMNGEVMSDVSSSKGATGL